MRSLINRNLRLFFSKDYSSGGDKMIKFKLIEDSNFKEFKTSNCNTNEQIPCIIGLIMVKNQEKKIIDTIKSALQLCDSITVVDTGSTDKTIENIKKYFPKVNLYHEEWVNDFAHMRNKCLKYISNKDWVLNLDADETMRTTTTKEELHKFTAYLNNLYPNKDIICTVKSLVNDSSAFARPQRLFKKSEHIQYHGMVHEEVISNTPNNLMELDTDLITYNKGQRPEEVSKFHKKELYSKLLLKQIALEPGNPRWVCMLAPGYIEENLLPKEKYEQLFLQNIFKESNMKIDLRNFKQGKYLLYLLEKIIFFYIIQGDLKKSLKFINEGRKLYPNDSNLIVYKYSIELEEQKRQDNLMLKNLLDFIPSDEHKQVLIDEASQGSEEALKIPMIRLLIMTRQYKEAKELYDTVDGRIELANLDSEKDLFSNKISETESVKKE